MKKPRMTPEEYVGKQGTECPFCGSTAITTGYMEYSDAKQPSTICEENTCLDCKAEWHGCFELVDYVVDREPEDEK